MRPIAHTFASLLLSTVLVSTASAQDDGDLDLRYDADGFGRRAVTGFDVLSNAALSCAPDGSCFATSTSSIGTDYDFRIRRFSPSGAFVAEGSAAFQLGGQLHDYAHATASQADERIVVAGYAQDGSADVFRLGVARFNPAPSSVPLDPTFSADGLADVNFNGPAWAYAVAVAPDGKIVVAGCYGTLTSSGDDIAVVRLTSTGAPDPTFDGNGVVTLALNHGGSNHDCAYAVAVQSDGRIVVTGRSETGTQGESELFVARLTTSGQTDTTFSGDGLATIVFDPIVGERNSARAVAIDRLGRIVVAGSVTDFASGTVTPAIARLTRTGTPDAFGVGGEFVGVFGLGSARSIAIAPPPSNRVFYLTDGALPQVGALTGGGVVDDSWGGGYVAFDDPAGTAEQSRKLTLLGGMPVVTGVSESGGTEYQIVGRYFTRLIFGDDFEGGGTLAWNAW